MNDVLNAVPSPEGQHYRVLAPPWLTRLLRLGSLAFGLGTLWLALRHWAAMPIAVNLLVCVLVPAFFLMALHPRGWAQFSTRPALVADRRGLYFPSLEPVVLGQPLRERWLFVPWSNVSNLREAKVMSADGACRCAAFDVAATAEQVREFFNRDLIGTNAASGDCTAVSFYEQALPRPREVISRLRPLMP